MQADWSAPTATAPGDNTAAPVNIGSTTQAKSGNLAANIFAATTEMRSDRYCDALGNNCTLSSSTQTRNLYTAMQNAGYPVPATPAGLINNQWPDHILCQHDGTPGRIQPLTLMRFTIGTEVRYEGGSYYYSFNPTTGAFVAKGPVQANCSTLSTGSDIVSICNSDLCVWD